MQSPPDQSSSAGFAELSDSQPTAYVRCTVPGTPGAWDHQLFYPTDEVAPTTPLNIGRMFVTAADLTMLWPLERELQRGGLSLLHGAFTAGEPHESLEQLVACYKAAEVRSLQLPVEGTKWIWTLGRASLACAMRQRPPAGAVPAHRRGAPAADSAGRGLHGSPPGAWQGLG